MQALCCECGNLRTYAGYTRGGVYGEGSDPSGNWHRCTGTMKCAECGKTTMHAVLRAGGYRDYAEEMQRIALGGTPTDMTDAARLRREYRLGLPRNPYLKHRHFIAEATKAWDEGRRTVIAICGEPDTISTDPRTWSKSNTEKNRQKHDGCLVAEVLGDTEYKDPDTGLWWTDMDCVDCRRSNALHFAGRRTLLQQMLAWFAAKPERIDDGDVEEVLTLLTRLGEKISDGGDQ